MEVSEVGFTTVLAVSHLQSNYLLHTPLKNCDRTQCPPLLKTGSVKPCLKTQLLILPPKYLSLP